MKKFIFLPLLLLLALPAGLMAQDNESAIDKYFQQYVDDERFTVVYISPKLFELFGELDIDAMDLEDEEARAFMSVASDLKGLRILTSDEDGKALYDEAKAKIETTEYETLMTVRDKDGENVDFLIKGSGDKVTELLLLAGGEDEDFVLISFLGNIDLEKVKELGKTMKQ